jgi:hypothetical protein
MSRSLPAVAAAAFALVAADLRAQQAPAPRFVVARAAAESLVTPVMALDSAAHYERAARRQSNTGVVLGAAGAAGLGAAYMGWLRNGRMGMNGGQAAALTVGAAAVALGWERWRHAQASEERALRWAARADVAADR